MKSFIPISWERMLLSVSSCVFVVICLSTGSAQAQSNMLQRYLKEVSDNNSGLQITEIEAAEARNHQVLSGVLDSPSLAASWSPYRVHTARGTIRSRLGVSQPLPFPGHRQQIRESLSFDVEEREVQLQALQLDLELQLKLVVDRVFYVQEMNRLIEAFDVNLQRFEEAALAQYETGSEQLSPILNIQNERRFLDLRNQRLQNDLHEVENLLSKLLNREVQSSELNGVTDRDLTPLDVVDVAGIVSSQSASIPEVRLAEIAVEKSESLFRLSKFDALPRFAVGAEYVDVQSSSISPAMTGRDALSLKFSVQLPIGKNARTLPRDQAALSIRKAEVHKAAELVLTSESVRHLSKQLSNLDEQRLMLVTDLIPRAQSVIASAMSSYTTGRISYLDVLESERSYFNLQIQLLDVNHNYKRTHALLERQLGVSSEVK